MDPEKSLTSASFLVSYYEQLRPKLNLLSCRLAVLRSFTVEPMVPLLRAAAFNAGIDLALHLSDFNAHAQEILDSQSALYAFLRMPSFLLYKRATSRQICGVTSLH